MGPRQGGSARHRFAASRGDGAAAPHCPSILGHDNSTVVVVLFRGLVVNHAMSNQILEFLLLVLNVLTIALIARAILSWVDPMARWQITRLLADATEPLIAPIRQIIPPVGMIDISFIVALLLVQVLQRLLISALG